MMLWRTKPSPGWRPLFSWARSSLRLAISGISAAAGYAALDPAGGRTGALIEAFAAGALLAMLADTLLPKVYKVEKVFTGPLVVIGFAISLGLSAA
jgi:zinc transporter, ZIP family